MCLRCWDVIIWYITTSHTHTHVFYRGQLQSPMIQEISRKKINELNLAGLAPQTQFLLYNDDTYNGGLALFPEVKS